MFTHRENGIYQQWTSYSLKLKKMCRKCIFWRSKLTELANKTVKKKINLWEKTAVNKSAWIKACSDSIGCENVEIIRITRAKS